MTNAELTARRNDTALAWRVARATGVFAMVALAAGLLTVPDLTLRLFWDLAIPLVPAVLFINPLIWRNLCPLGTLNTAGNGLLHRSYLSPRAQTVLAALGVTLLFLLIPARRFLLNQDALVMALVVIALGVLAFGLGTVFEARSGFCNSFCPVLPVERLYGQSPLIDVTRTHCAQCTVCTPRGCIDLAPAKAPAQALGPDRRSARWLATPFGVFAVAFPGVVLGYFTATDVPLTSAFDIYAQTAVYAVLSAVLAGGIVLVFDLAADRVLPVIALVAGGLYYWFASATLAGWLPDDLVATGTVSIRAAAALLLAWWVLRVARRTRGVV